MSLFIVNSLNEYIWSENQIKWGNNFFSDLISNLIVSVCANVNTRASCLMTIYFQSVFIHSKTRVFVHTKIRLAEDYVCFF